MKNKTAILLSSMLSITGCASVRPPVATVPQAEQWTPLSRGGVHLGNNDFTLQSFDTDGAHGPTYCALVYLPRAANSVVAIQGLRNTEEPTNRLQIDEHSIMLPMLLRQAYRSSSAMALSTAYSVSLSAGPHQVCVIAGAGSQPGDLDDFEFSALMLRADGVRADEIVVRHEVPAPSAGMRPDPYRNSPL